MPHPAHPMCIRREAGNQPMFTATPANKDQDLLSVAAEVQRMVECGGFKPIPVEVAVKQLSLGSATILMQHRVSLVEALEAHPKSVRVTIHDGCQVVSWYGVTWLGPGPPPPQRVPEPAPVAWSAASEPAALQPGTCSIQRGKALENMNQLAGTQELQEALQDFARCLLLTPHKTLLVSELGCKMAPGSRAFLRTAKLRAAQLLQCFPDDFELKGSGPATAVTYLHDSPLVCFRPQPRLRELNNARFCRLLKLAADVSECYSAQGVTAREVLDCLNDCLLVDCRTLTERSQGILPNSVAACDLTDRNLAGGEWVVAYCCVGCRAAKWCTDVIQNSRPGSSLVNRVRYLIGGIASWTHFGGQILDPQSRMPTKKVHCWVPELASFFPVARSGYEVACPVEPNDGWGLGPSPTEALGTASGIRYSRLRVLSWEVRLRYWPSVFCVEAQDILDEILAGDKSGYILVDCRTPEEREVSTIAGQGLPVITSEELSSRAMELLWDSGYTAVTFCTVGGRSGVFSKRLCERLVQEGAWTDAPQALSRKVLNMLGGIASWLHNGGGLTDSMGRPTKRFHPWCHAFLDLFPIENLEFVMDEARPDPADALCFAACKMTACEANEGVPQKLLQICNVMPREVISDSLTRAMRSVHAYED
uniref:Rhodanese domain-containing protein n=1 Tax=Pyrodinium bahamense TaxID=73915 RepID=A0A7S0B6Q5_9DINO